MTLNIHKAGAWANQYRENAPISVIAKWVQSFLRIFGTISNKQLNQIQIWECVREEWDSPRNVKSSLGYNPLTLAPKRGPEHDRHHRKLIQAAMKSSGLSFETGESLFKAYFEEKFVEGMLTVPEAARLLSQLRLSFALPSRCIPSNQSLRLIMAHIIDGYFGVELQNKMLSTYLLWSLNIKARMEWERCPETGVDKPLYTIADDTAYGWLNDLLEEQGHHVKTTAFGVSVEGQNGAFYEITPSPKWPHYKVHGFISENEHGCDNAKVPHQGILLKVPPKERRGHRKLPMGDYLLAIVLALRNDISTAREVCVLRNFLDYRAEILEEEE